MLRGSAPRAAEAARALHRLYNTTLHDYMITKYSYYIITIHRLKFIIIIMIVVVLIISMIIIIITLHHML